MDKPCQVVFHSYLSVDRRGSLASPSLGEADCWPHNHTKGDVVLSTPEGI